MDIEEIRAKRMAELQAGGGGGGQGGGQGGDSQEEIQKLNAAREHRVSFFNHLTKRLSC
jgi:DNA-binding TFAR19-related protein (PDSD5 family)